MPYTDAGVAAAARGFPVIDPNTGRVRDGANEINITRDLIAKVAGYGTTLPATADEGDIFFRYTA